VGGASWPPVVKDTLSKLSNVLCSHRTFFCTAIFEQRRCMQSIREFFFSVLADQRHLHLGKTESFTRTRFQKEEKTKCTQTSACDSSGRHLWLRRRSIRERLGAQTTRTNLARETPSGLFFERAFRPTWQCGGGRDASPFFAVVKNKKNGSKNQKPKSFRV
jgi:hypothetical protein